VAEKDITGVAGVLRGLIDVPSAAECQSARNDHPQREADDRIVNKPGKDRSIRARLGRPPGRTAGASPPREKLTIRVSADLATAYRDWSWEARCQLGELVESAMHSYLGRRPR
jgi:hypothetical protein